MMPSNNPKTIWSIGVRQPNGCLLWTRSKARGYGKISVNNVRRLVHRLSWELTNGAIPGGFLICHRCDNKACFEPAHLFLGTPKDNMMDKSEKGRATGGRPKNKWTWKYCNGRRRLALK